MAKSILVIDDETMILDAIKIIFEDMGHSVQTTPDPIHGTEVAIAQDFDLILTDIRMPVREWSRDHRAGAREEAPCAHPRDHCLPE